jgi:superfamily I DNA/RNA helicase
MISRSSNIIIAGDDDLAIYKWAGANVNQFINYECSEQIILNKSYRVPLAILEASQKLVSNLSTRINKEYSPNSNKGEFRYINELDELNMDTGQWLLLARNGYMLREYEEYCEINGYPYTSVYRNPMASPALKAVVSYEKLRRGVELNYNEMKVLKGYTTLDLDNINKNSPIWHKALDKLSYKDREYYISVLRRGESLIKKPRIHISTIHSVKGGESENVVIMTDMSKKTYDMYQLDLDNEIRVFYVGITRAKNNCYVLSEKTNRYFDLI